MVENIAVFWFRRDLRLADNTGLFHALSSGFKVLPVFIYDKNILDKLENNDPRISFISESIDELQIKIKEAGSVLATFYSSPESAFMSLCRSYKIKAVFCNSDYEPYGIERDKKLKEMLGSLGIQFFTFKDHVIFEKSEIVKDDNKPYTVFTPYSSKWLRSYNQALLREVPSTSLIDKFLKASEQTLLLTENPGYVKSSIKVKKYNLDEELIMNYSSTRDIPSVNGTTHLSPHLRYGTISIREVIRRTSGINLTFTKELIWREFFIQVLFHFPHVTESSFKAQYDRIEWINNEDHFEKWCAGKTGFPIVDAGMRELDQTGYMHNRVRMIAANFLTRYLLTDWRWGEAWFASKLLDFELASNNGNWQWAAGTGCDAAPYFRVFNPASQQKKFDKDCAYIKKWIPEFGTPSYPKPVVVQSDAREKAIRLYKAGLNS